MNAIRMVRDDAVSPPSLILTQVPRPELLPGHVLVKVKASAIQPSDIMNSQGGFGSTVFPRTAGRDFAGVIVEGPPSLIGKEVFGTSGDSLAFTADGAQAEFLAISEKAVVEKPAGLSFSQAATIGVPVTTAELTVRRSGAQAGETVLVLGANGAVGKAVVLLAQAKGCKVFRGVRGPHGDVDTSGDPSLTAVKSLTNGKGVDVVIDTVGQLELTAAAADALAQGGRLTFITAPKSGPGDLSIPLKDFYRKEKSLIGCNSVAYTIEQMAERLQSLTSTLSPETWTSLAEGKWEDVKLQDGVEAYATAKQQRGKKYVIVMD